MSGVTFRGGNEKRLIKSEALNFFVHLMHLEAFAQHLVVSEGTLAEEMFHPPNGHQARGRNMPEQVDSPSQ